MGQRHQLFVIARVKGRYRTLCAVHHQWLYGHTALRRCLGTLKIFQDPTNRLPIQQELIAASNHDDNFWAPPCDKEYDVPFPFIATCLVLGASYSPDGYHHQVSLESFCMAYNDGDNNNGITIFDITNLSHVQYCFVDFNGMESDREVPLMTPLSARTYLEAYSILSDPGNSRDLVPLVEAFDEWGLIATATLENTWPGEGWEADDEVDVEDELDDEIQRLDEELAKPEVELARLHTNPVDTPMTLRDSAMDKLLQSLMKQPDDDSDSIAEAELLTDFLPKLRAKFYDQATQLKPSSSLLRLLGRALENETEVDLSPFTTLSAKDLSLVVSKLQSHGKMAILNLSNRPDIGETELNVILGPDLNLRALCLLEMPQIPSRSLGAYSGHCEVYHSDILRLPLVTDPYEEHKPTLAPALSTNNTITQIQWLGMSYMDSTDKAYRLDDGRIAWDTLKLAAKGRNPFGPSKGELEYRSCDLDIPFPAGKMVQGFLRLLQWGASANMGPSSSDDWWKGVACSLAASPPRDSTGTGHGVGLLSPSLWIQQGRYNRSQKEKGPTGLKIGQWALILFSEAFNARSQEFLDEVFEKRHPVLKPSAAASEPNEPSKQADCDLDEPSSSDIHPLTRSLDPKAQMDINTSLFREISKLHSPGDKTEQRHSRPTVQPPSFRPRKGIKYALVTPVAGSETDFSIADVPACLEQLMGDKAQDLVDLWNGGFASLETAEFYGNDDNFVKFLQKLNSGKTRA
ncbi:hypothetical protein N7G274_005608 [Stereocaulon virgatum]|uniref:NADP-dependent oxidoreductase domain-containing protein n=1 Tax=Stereocaulon virgatum TaxID=373712 RepID=A0ABR4AAR6_9LECA